MKPVFNPIQKVVFTACCLYLLANIAAILVKMPDPQIYMLNMGVCLLTFAILEASAQSRK